MKTIKTAISLENTLLQEMDTLAHDMGISRKRIFEMAAQEFLDRHKDMRVLEAINEAYADRPTP